MRLADYPTTALLEEIDRRKAVTSAGEAIVAQVASAFGLPQALIMSCVRRARVSRARHVAMVALHNQGFSTVAVAEFFGMSPSTVAYALEVVHAEPVCRPSANPAA